MTFARLLGNARRSTLNAQRPSISSGVNDSASKRSSRAGMTMVELVAALALFVIILGSLLTVMDTASDLWSSPRSQQEEQTIAETVTSLMADDLYEAVTDNGATTNDLTETGSPTFYLQSPVSNSAPGDVTVVLGFVRHASSRTAAQEADELMLSLDAVFYTYYDSALFRHVIPLAQTTSFAEPEPLGSLFETQLQKIMASTSVHKELLDAVQDPTTSITADWTCSLLAQRIELGISATLPPEYAGQDGADTVQPSQFEATALPDSLDFAFCLYNAQDWASYLQIRNDTSDEAMRKKRQLGLLYSKRFVFPTREGSRL